MVIVSPGHVLTLRARGWCQFYPNTEMNNEGRIYFLFFYFLGPEQIKNAVISKREDANWVVVAVVSVASLEY